MVKKALSDTEKMKELAGKLEERYERWDDLKINGGNDPFWEDGVNMYLVRNHIIYYKKKCWSCVKIGPAVA